MQRALSSALRTDMSRFLSPRHAALIPYTPGEQPKDAQYIKLNTNESPYPPSQKAQDAASEAAKHLQLYPDPTCSLLVQTLADTYGVKAENVILGNGSDEILQYAFLAFCDADSGVVFPDITYGFYRVFAELYHIPYTEIPLQEDFTVDLRDYGGVGKPIFIANPNAPTGIALTLSQIEDILKTNPDTVVVIDEAYVDFGCESAVGLINKYDNLLVVQTFSKSRSMAGARLGMAFGNRNLICDLNTIRYSLNPYNINRMTMAAGLGILADEAYTKQNCLAIQDTRAYTMEALTSLGFACLSSKTNFIFARHPKMSGEEIYLKLKQRNILVRHFSSPRLTAYNRITIGTKAQMKALVDALKDILEATP